MRPRKFRAVRASDMRSDDQPLLFPHLDDSPLLFAAGGSPELYLIEATRQGYLEAVEDHLRVVNPNVLRAKEEKPPLSIAVRKRFGSVVEALLAAGADPFFPASWGYSNLWSGYGKRFSDGGTCPMSVAMEDQQWEWASRFAQVGFPPSVPETAATRWLTQGLLRGLPVEAWKEYRHAMVKQGFEKPALFDAVMACLVGLKGKATPVGAYALLLKEEEPKHCLAQWREAVDTVCAGHQYNPKEAKPKELMVLVRLYMVEAQAQGHSSETITTQLLKWGKMALLGGRSELVKDVFGKLLAQHSWELEQQLDWLNACWQEEQQWPTSLDEELGALRHHWKPVGFARVVQALDQQQEQTGGAWMTALPSGASSGSSSFGIIARATARMAALNRAAVPFPEGRRAEWMSRLLHLLPDVEKAQSWSKGTALSFVKEYLAAGFSVATVSTEGFTLQGLLTRVAAQNSEVNQSLSPALSLLRASALDESLPVPARSSGSRPRF